MTQRGETPAPPLEVVVAGGGVAALEAMLALHELAGDRVHTTLVSPATELEIRALRTIATFTGHALPRPSLRELARRCGATLRPTVVRRVVADEHAVMLGDGRTLAYDALVLAIGARPETALEGAITFGLESEADDLGAALADVEAGFATSLAFVVPPGITWSLPLYELALMSAQRLRDRTVDARLVLVTPESAPLAIFGPPAADAVGRLLAEAGVELRTASYASMHEPGVLALAPGGERLAADRIVALPHLAGRALRGRPTDTDGFVPIDDHGRAPGVADVWAAGDATTFPVKQGGIACQLADAIAEQLAQRAGADVSPQPFRPVLRGRLVTGEGAEVMHAAPAGGAGEGVAAWRPLWLPARKVDGRHLSEALGAVPGFAPRGGHVDVDVELPAPPLALDPYSPTVGRR
jgi:sulfide:quinone oxidoreductase